MCNLAGAWNAAVPPTGDGRATISTSLIQDLKTTCTTSTDAHVWACTMKTYAQIRWFVHLGNIYQAPSRKLRKCYLRKIQQRIKRERRRYL